MALGLGKEAVRGPLRGARAGKGAEYPSKTSMNLLSSDAGGGLKRSTLVGIVVVALVVLFFAKFAVFDQFAKVGQKEAELAEAQAQLAATQQQLGSYGAVLSEYQAYTGGTGGAQGVPDSLKVVQMVDRVLGSGIKTTAINMQGNTVSVSIAGVTLKQVGDLSTKFSQEEIVQNVSVATADNGARDAKKVAATLVLTLSGAEENTTSADDGKGE